MEYKRKRVTRSFYLIVSNKKSGFIATSSKSFFSVLAKSVILLKKRFLKWYFWVWTANRVCNSHRTLFVYCIEADVECSGTELHANTLPTYCTLRCDVGIMNACAHKQHDACTHDAWQHLQENEQSTVCRSRAFWEHPFRAPIGYTIQFIHFSQKHSYIKSVGKHWEERNCNGKNNVRNYIDNDSVKLLWWILGKFTVLGILCCFCNLCTAFAVAHRE